jgi:ATP-dependent DNA ligase
MRGPSSAVCIISTCGFDLRQGQRSRGASPRGRLDSAAATPNYSGMLRVRPDLVGFIEPCLPSAADRLPAGPGWIHEIKHDGFRLMARRDAAGTRLITRKGNDFTARFQAIATAVTGLRVRSCVIDGEAIACDESGLAVFDLIRRRRHHSAVVLCAFDLLELNGRDLRRWPIEDRKRTLQTLLKSSERGSLRCHEIASATAERAGRRRAFPL